MEKPIEKYPYNIQVLGLTVTLWKTSFRVGDAGKVIRLPQGMNTTDDIDYIKEIVSSVAVEALKVHRSKMESTIYRKIATNVLGQDIVDILKES